MRKALRSSALAVLLSRSFDAGRPGSVPRIRPASTSATEKAGRKSTGCSRFPPMTTSFGGFVGIVALTALALGCDPPPRRKPITMTPIGTVPIATRTTEEPDGGTTTTPNSGTPSPEKEAACTGGDFDALDDALKQCDSKMPGP